jgi:N-acetylmuramoyl-L-alanine amidase CwlA
MPPPNHGASTKRSKTMTSTFHGKSTCPRRLYWSQWISSYRSSTSSEKSPNQRRKSSPEASCRSRTVGSSNSKSLKTKATETSPREQYTDQSLHNYSYIVMDEERKQRLLARLAEESRQDKAKVDEYLNSLVIKRNRTSLVMNSFMHNVVDIENSVETTRQFLK